MLELVMKTHNVNHIGAFVANSSTGIFITTGTKERGRKMADRLTKKTGKSISLIQDLETLSEIKTVGFLDLEILPDNTNVQDEAAKIQAPEPTVVVDQPPVE